MSQDRHQNIKSISESDIDQPVERPVRVKHTHRRARHSPTSSSDKEGGNQFASDNVPTVERWSLQQAIEDVFRVVPNTLCPEVDAPPRRKNM